MKKSLNDLLAVLDPERTYAEFRSGRETLEADPHNFTCDALAFLQLMREVRPRLIIEVGSWKGHSAIHMADCARALGLDTRILCVDTWLGSPEHWNKPDLLAELKVRGGRATLYDSFLSNVILSGADEQVIPFPLTSSAAAEVLAHYNVQADLIYIDGAHDYASVLRDLKDYSQLLAPGGVLFGDDYKIRQVLLAARDFASGHGRGMTALGNKWFMPRADENLERLRFADWTESGADSSTRVALFGCGLSGNRVIDEVRATRNLVAVLDNDPAKQGQPFGGLTIQPASALAQIEYDEVILAAGFPSMVKQLVEELGVEPGRIVGTDPCKVDVAAAMAPAGQLVTAG